MDVSSPNMAKVGFDPSSCCLIDLPAAGAQKACHTSKRLLFRQPWGDKCWTGRDPSVSFWALRQFDILCFREFGDFRRLFDVFFPWFQKKCVWCCRKKNVINGGPQIVGTAFSAVLRPRPGPAWPRQNSEGRRRWGPPVSSNVVCWTIACLLGNWL